MNPMIDEPTAVDAVRAVNAASTPAELDAARLVCRRAACGKVELLPSGVEYTSAPGLTFSELRAANRQRVGLFKNKHGERAHSMADGSDWSPAQWLGALVGELGEYANYRKKYERGDMTAAEFEEVASKELADVQTYLDLLAQRCLDTAGSPHPIGVNLGDATVQKFNEVSRRVGVNVRLGPLASRSRLAAPADPGGEPLTADDRAFLRNWTKSDRE